VSGGGGEDGRWAGEARAKVNLDLRILAREASGYHQIETVLQRLELADRVGLELRTDGEVRLEVKGVPPGELGPADANLAVRAARCFQEALAGEGERFPGVSILLEKRIPHGAGLGGGSADAAAVLLGLDRLLAARMGRTRLLHLGAALGADVPFLATGVPCALAWGRGDRILPLPPLPVRTILLAVPSPGVSTPWAYGILASHREAGMSTCGPIVRGELGPGGWSRIAADARNEFEDALFPHRPDLARVKSELLGVGARVALLSGSGSALFGVFDEPSLAEEAEEALRGVLSDLPGLRWFRTRTVATPS